MFQMLVCFLVISYFKFSQCLDTSWYSFQQDFINRNREELVITKIETDENFNLNINVTQWKSLKVGPICYNIGLSKNSLVLMQSRIDIENTEKFNITTKIKDFDKSPSDVILFYNRKNGAFEIICIVTFHEELFLHWFKLQNLTLVPFWKYPVASQVLHINSLNTHNINLLFLVFKEYNTTVVQLIEFNLKSEKPRHTFLTSVEIPELPSSSTFTVGEQVNFLSVAQPKNGLVLIYKLQKNYLEFYQEISSPYVHNIISFQICFKSYLAIDGYDAAIYEFTEDDLIKQNIANSNLDHINFWLAVPVETYRDEVIILAQRSLDHYTHRSNDVEIIINNGGKFEEHEDIPCYYFGEESSRLTCLTEDVGVLGASYISVQDKQALIVPRPNKSTNHLFLINYEVKSLPDPKQDDISQFLIEKEQLQILLQSQMQEYQDFKNYKFKDISEPEETEIVGSSEPRAPDNFELKNKVDSIKSEVLNIEKKVNKIVEAESKTNIDTIIINGTANFTGYVITDRLDVENIGETPATYLLRNIVNKENLTTIVGKKTFVDLDVDDLIFKTTSNVKAEDLINKKDSSIILNGDITFENNVITETIDAVGKVNDIDFITNAVTLQDKYQGSLELAEVIISNTFKIKNLLAENTNDDIKTQNKTDDLESLFIRKNITVTSINGLNLNKLISELCLINIGCYIPGNTTIEGTISTKNISTEYLNDLQFPGEYILQDSRSFAVITGTKDFQNSLEATEVRNSDVISGINTTEIVTLSTHQDINGKLIFENLQLTEQLNVTGNVTGKYVDKFLPNPTLLTTNNIKSNVNFARLEVEGNIIIENYFNNHNYSNLLDNIVYKDEPTVIINSTKEFPRGLTVENNLEIGSNSINDINLDWLVSKELEQNLGSRILKGDVLIKNLHVFKNYAGKNITQLDESLVKLTGEQFIASTLIFNDDIHVNVLKINKLNDLQAEDYLYTNADMEIDLDTTFENITAENILVEKDLHGNITGLDLDGIMDNYLSYTENQYVENPIRLTYSKVDDLKALRLNDMEAKDLLESDILKEIKDMLNSGEVQIQNLVVNGYLQINNINGKKVHDLLPKNPFENKTKITIRGDIYCNELEINALSSYSWKKYTEQIVFKNETSVELNGTKTFTGAFTVEKLIETEKINNILLENVLTKEGKQYIKGPIIINGDVVFKNLKSNNITNTLVEPILNRLRIENETYVVQGDMVFERLAHIHNLTISGTLNQKNISKTFLDLVLLDENVVLEQPIFFTGPVTFAKNLTVSDTINNVNFSKKVSQIVRTNRDAEIKKVVHFNKLVVINDKFIVDEDFECNTLYGINTNEWLENAVFVNQGLLKGSYVFENITIEDSLTTKYINNIDTSKFVNLKSNGSVDYLEFEEIMAVKDIKVGGLVNGYQLPQEFENTAMIDRDQAITTDVVFQNNIVVRKNVFVDIINENNASKIVTTNTDQNLTSVYKFHSPCTIYSDLEVHGLINDINISLWENSLKMFSPEKQYINSELNILNNLTFSDDVRIDGTIDHLNLTAVAIDVEKMRNYKLEVEQGIINDYNSICTDMTYLHQKAKSQLYKFKYFEAFQHFSFQNNLQNIFFFNFQNNQYMLVTEENCFSHIIIFNSKKFDFLTKNIETGQVVQVVPVYANNTVYLVIRGGTETSCSIKGTNIWEFTPATSNLQAKFKIEDQILLQESLVPNTFYGLNKEEIVEYQVDENDYKKYRKWTVSEENAAFMPRGLETGLALRTGQKILYLERSAPITENSFDPDIEVIVGSTNDMQNSYIPGRNVEELVVATVGIKSARKRLLAYIAHTKTNVNSDLIKIFENPLSGDLFQEIRTNRPSSLITIEFDQGETLLIFLENKQVLQIYEYKGIEGFKAKQSAKITGSKILPMSLPIEGNLNLVKTLGIMDKNTLKMLRSVMIGNKMKEDFECGL